VINKAAKPKKEITRLNALDTGFRQTMTIKPKPNIKAEKT
jgi:hypothetical protein